MRGISLLRISDVVDVIGVAAAVEVIPTTADVEVSAIAAANGTDAATDGDRSADAAGFTAAIIAVFKDA